MGVPTRKTGKSRKPLITKGVKKPLINHIYENAKSKDIYINEMNGGKEHLHLLVSLGASQSISKIAHLLKGESSNWVNKNKLTKNNFEWQDEYFAVSVSESLVASVRKYIQNQKEHLRIKPYLKNIRSFLINMDFLNNGAKARVLPQSIPRHKCRGN